MSETIDVANFENHCSLFANGFHMTEGKSWYLIGGEGGTLL